MFRPLVPLILLVAAWGCGKHPAAFGGSGPELRSCRGNLERSVLLSGELKALDADEIRVPRTPLWNARISWMIEDGTEVRSGQRILEFDSTSFSSSLENDRSEAERIEGELEVERANARLRLIDAELRLSRAKIAVEDARLEALVPESLIGAKRVEDARIALRKAELELEQATRALDVVRSGDESGIRRLEVELDRARRKVEVIEKSISALVVRPPKDGVVTVAEHPWEGRKFQVGDSPWVGLTVMRIPRLEHIAVRARLFDVDDGLVRPGMEASCRLDMYPGDVYSGIVRDITPIANETGPFSLRRVFELTIDLENPDTSKMRPGMSLRVEIPLAPVKDAVLVPREALEIKADGARVHLAGDRWQDILLGMCSARWCVVEEGLAEDLPLMCLGETSS